MASRFSVYGIPTSSGMASADGLHLSFLRRDSMHTFGVNLATCLVWHQPIGCIILVLRNEDFFILGELYYEVRFLSSNGRQINITAISVDFGHKKITRC